jgi:siderophore synthetase component
MNLREVRSWAQRRGIGRREFRHSYDGSFLIAISGLLRALHREGLVRPTSLQKDLDGSLWLRIGDQLALVAPLVGGLPLQRIEVIGPPCLERDGMRRPLRTTREFARVLHTVLTGGEMESSFDRILEDFNDSFANLVLNRLLFKLGGSSSRALEPAFQGHTIYPFPALRRGPSLDQVVECSHLSPEPVALQLAKAYGASFHSVTFPDAAACTRAWMGRTVDDSNGLLVPIHPWQLALSPVVQGLLGLGICKLTEGSLLALPLASQRTCRILETGYDVKLPIDVTLTGEHRLLFPANARNAPVVSALTLAAREYAMERTIDFQYDLASIVHCDPTIGTHMSMIVRGPVPKYGTDLVVPALNLWMGYREAWKYLRVHMSVAAEDVFAAYCRVLMRGPIEFFVCFGIALEPHLQNVLVWIRDGMPHGIVVRDLDSTVLDPRRVPSFLRECNLELPTDVWREMPIFDAGGARLTHAILHSHLAVVAAYLSQECGADPETLEEIVEETWAGILSSTPAAERHLVANLRSRAGEVKCLLRMRLAGSSRLLFLNDGATNA